MRFYLLDGIRGCAAIIVLLLHAGIALGMPRPENGEIAVDIFFCLSGFVMLHTYQGRLGEQIGWREFFRRRFIRLYPMIAVGVVIGGAIFLVSPNSHAGFSPSLMISTVALSFVLFPTPLFFGIPNAFAVDGPLWSLFFEAILNILLYVTISRKMRAGNYFAIAALAGVGFVFAIRYVGDPLQIGIGSLGSYSLAIFRAAFPFFLGAGIACVKRPLTRSRVPFCLTAAATLFFIFWNGSGTHSVYLHTLACFVLVPSLIYFGSQVALSNNGNRICNGLGEISYPLYVIHAPLLQGVRVIARDIPQFGAAALIIYVFALSVCVFISYYMLVKYDRPVRSWLSSRMRHGICDTTLVARDPLLGPSEENPAVSCRPSS